MKVAAQKNGKITKNKKQIISLKSAFIRRSQFGTGYKRTNFGTSNTITQAAGVVFLDLQSHITRHHGTETGNEIMSICFVLPILC
jgi:hypothetical protein